MTLIRDHLVSAKQVVKAGHTAVVTGASSGIGKAACLKFASCGMNVYMVDIDEEELEQAKELVQKQVQDEKQKIHASVVDVADSQAMQELASLVFSNHGKCHILMNNAGTGIGEGALADIEIVQKAMNTNLYGPINGCLAFLTEMKKSNEPGIVINTGSKQGITMPPGNLTYNTSKAALKCYTEGLEHELMLDRLDGTGKIRAALLVPGWVNTNIAAKAEKQKRANTELEYDPQTQVPFSEENPQSGAWMPSQVIDFMLQELEKNTFYIICPDNDVDRETDNLRITWTTQDITQNRPPLSRWHPEYEDKFKEFMQQNKKGDQEES